MMATFSPCLIVARRTFVLGVTALLLSASVLSAQAVKVPARVTLKVDDSARAQLHGSVLARIKVSQDLGVVPDTAKIGTMVILLDRSPLQKEQLSQLFTQLHDPSSPKFHQWLTPQQYGDQFGPADEDVTAVTTWLQGKGFTVRKVSAGKIAVVFSGTAGQVKNAFRTELHTYSLKGETFHANNSDPVLPTALLPVVAGVGGLNDIKPKEMNKPGGTASFNPKTHATAVRSAVLAQPDWVISNGPGYYPNFALTPGDFAIQYNTNPIYQAGITGKGVNLGIFGGGSDFDPAPILAYRKLFGQPQTLPILVVEGPDPGDSGGGIHVEEQSLDIETTGSIAPGAQLYFYNGGDVYNIQDVGYTGYGFANSILRVIDDNVVDILSVSYGLCEQDLGQPGNLFFDSAWSQAAAQGQSVFTASGDSGVINCGLQNAPTDGNIGTSVSGWSSPANNVAVGGTDFFYSQYAQGEAGYNAQIPTYWNTTESTTPTISLLKTVPEQVWNGDLGLNLVGFNQTRGDGTVTGGGGGASSCAQGTSPDTPDQYTTCTGGYAKPSWQSAPGVPKDGVRDLPDVSLFASNGYNFVVTPFCILETDCGAPDPNNNGNVDVSLVGGTSVSTPSMAGIMALIVESQHGRQGNPNYVLYALANQKPSVFRDITVGSNDQFCVAGTPQCIADANGDGYGTYGIYSAGAGYDQASGLGTFDANALLNNWGSVAFIPTTTSLSLSATTIQHGNTVTGTSAVTGQGGNATGDVALVTNLVTQSVGNVGTIQLGAGSEGSAALNALPGGTYTITADYGGDGKFAPSKSTPVALTVSPEQGVLNATTRYTEYQVTTGSDGYDPFKSGTSLPFGNFGFEFNIKVTGTSGNGHGSGTVVTLDNGSPINTSTLDVQGNVTVFSTNFAVGAHQISFTYGGDASFSAAQLTGPAFTVVRSAPSVFLFIGNGGGAPITIRTGPVLVEAFAATEFGTVPIGGSITVSFGNQTSRAIPVQPYNFLSFETLGEATAVFDGSAVGSYEVSATYSGDSNFLPATNFGGSGIVTIVQDRRPATTTTLTSNGIAASPGDPVTFTMKVTGGTSVPTGTINLVAEGFPEDGLDGQQLDATGSATYTGNNSFGSDENNVYAVYQGDNTHAPSISNVIVVNFDTGDFTLAPANSALAIASGSTGSDVLVAISGGLQGVVALQCVTSSPLLSCSLSPSSLTLPQDPSGSVSSVVTVTAVKPEQAGLNKFKMFGLGGGATLALLFFWVPARRRSWKYMASLTLLAGMGLSILGCTSIGKFAGNTLPTTPVASTGTPPGSYTVTVTGSLDTLVHTATIRVTVQ